jgi:hypothetical protein
MSIKFVTTDGTVFETLEAAQSWEAQTALAKRVAEVLGGGADGVAVVKTIEMLINDDGVLMQMLLDEISAKHQDALFAYVASILAKSGFPVNAKRLAGLAERVQWTNPLANYMPVEMGMTANEEQASA